MTTQCGSGIFRLALLQAATAVSVLALAGLVGWVAGGLTSEQAPALRWQGGVLMTPAVDRDETRPVTKGDRGVFTIGVAYDPAEASARGTMSPETRIADAHQLLQPATGATFAR